MTEKERRDLLTPGGNIHIFPVPYPERIAQVGIVKLTANSDALLVAVEEDTDFGIEGCCFGHPRLGRVMVLLRQIPPHWTEILTGTLFGVIVGWKK